MPQSLLVNQKVLFNINEIFATNFKILEIISTVIHLPLDPPNFKMPSYHIFENIDAVRVQALIGVGIGCDVSPGGILMLVPNYWL